VGKLGLSLIYILPVALVAWAWFGGNVGSRIRHAVFMLLPLMYIMHWIVLENLEGWPSDVPPHAGFELVDVDVIEPDKKSGHDGEIYMWVRTARLEAPRAHRLAYSRALHEMLHSAKKKLEQGIRQQGVVAGREKGGEGASIGNGLMLHVSAKPPPDLPPKTFQ